VSFFKPGRYLKCVRHNAYVTRGEYQRLEHTSASTKKKICDGLEFLIVTVESVDRDSALEFASQRKAETEQNNVRA
jgi:hypothetical protein